MKLSKSLLQAMLVAITAGTIISCEKAQVGEGKKVMLQNPKSGVAPQGGLPDNCPACGMG